MRGLSCLVIVLTLVFLNGCSAVLPSPDQSSLPPRILLHDVPFFAQQEYQCGPAALAMLLAWNGEQVVLPRVTEQVYSPGRKGTLQPALVAAARRNGYLAYPLQGQDALLRELAAGHPVLVLLNLGFSWVPYWHYAVVIGYDLTADQIFLHSGTEAEAIFSAGVFSRTWARSQDWGLLVLPAGTLPATAEEQVYLNAASGLERAGRNLSAAHAYQAAVQQWPDSFAAWMGLGNSRYAQTDLPAAAAAFRQASRLHSTSGEAWNNLAVVLAAAGQREQALAAIDRAIALGGHLQESFLQTRQEILAGEIK